MSAEPPRGRSPALLAGVAVLAMLAWVGLRNAREDEAALTAAYRMSKGAFSAGERESFEALASQGYATLRSEAFQTNLRDLAGRYPLVYARRGRPDVAIEEVADLVALKKPGARYVPADVILSDQPGAGYDALGFAAQGPGEGRYSDIVLGRDVFDLWRSADTVRKSCAVAVAAHEYAHTISTLPFVYQTAFTDTNEGEPRIRDRVDRTTPVASYLLGVVAQCTWLQQHGRIGRADVPACVEVFGVSSPNLQRCDAFPGSTPVLERPGLPPKTPPL